MFPLVALCALVTSSLVALVCTLVSVTCRDLRPCEALWAVNAGYSVPSCPAMPCSGQDRAQTEQLLVHALVHGPRAGLYLALYQPVLYQRLYQPFTYIERYRHMHTDQGLCSIAARESTCNEYLLLRGTCNCEYL